MDTEQKGPLTSSFRKHENIPSERKRKYLCTICSGALKGVNRPGDSSSWGRRAVGAPLRSPILLAGGGPSQAALGAQVATPSCLARPALRDHCGAVCFCWAVVRSSHFLTAQTHLPTRYDGLLGNCLSKREQIQISLKSRVPMSVSRLSPKT